MSKPRCPNRGTNSISFLQNRFWTRVIDDKYTFEIGGRNKGFKQIKEIRNSFLALDDIETGINNKIPLWLFGFLY